MLALFSYLKTHKHSTGNTKEGAGKGTKGNQLGLAVEMIGEIVRRGRTRER